MYKTKINHTQKLFTKAQFEQLVKNGKNRDQDHAPVVKFFNPVGAATWLISELDEDDNYIAFGLCDMGFGCPELGIVDLRELIDIQKHRMLGIERDLWFEGKFPMSHYVDKANEKGRITD